MLIKPLNVSRLAFHLIRSITNSKIGADYLPFYDLADVKKTGGSEYNSPQHSGQSGSKRRDDSDDEGPKSK